ncbi:zonadhesin-like [Saccostrea cucullata]|uniref:zonadhesin-like n=1 Tax=Saccostrea cuccullata TaxID=36930 RepID=UPI002ED1D440
MVFPGWKMPCPVDHIDCYSNTCYCSPDRVTTTELPTTPTTATSILTTKTSIPTTKTSIPITTTSIPTTKLSMSTTKTSMSTTKTSTTTKVTTTEKITESTNKMPVTTALPAIVTSIQPVSFPIHTSGKTCSLLTDCIGEICPLGTHPYCRYSLTSNSCQCTECTEHSHCSCSSGLQPHCSFDFPLQTYFCLCKAIPVPDPTISGHLIGK